MTTEGSSPQFATIWRRGSSSARRTILMPASWSALSPLMPRYRSTGTQQRDAAAGNDTFFHCRAGCVQGVFNACFFLFHFDFGSGADFDQRYPASQLGHALLQFLLVVVAGGFFDLVADLLDPALNSSGDRRRRR